MKLRPVSAPVAFLFGLAVSNPLIGQESPQVGSERPSMELGKFVTPPEISETPDLSEWLNYRVNLQFSPFKPSNRGPLPEGVETIVYAGWGKDALYVAIEALDPRPDQIVEGKRKRDTIPETLEDYVSLIVDPTGRGQYGYEFRVGASGVQQDARIIESAPPDNSYDLIWDSKGYKTSRGYVVKIRIPFESLGVVRDQWRLRVLRNLPRDRYYSMTWPPQNDQPYAFLSNAGSIRGCSVSQDRGTLMAIVSGTAQRTYSSETGGSKNDTNLGLDVRWRSVGGMRADLTVHPDFSTIESDVDPLAVNTRFKVALPEKRPFFLEGMDTLLDTNLVQQVNTRSILQPNIGLKASSSHGDFSWGALALTDDRGGDALATDGALTAGMKTRDFAGAGSIAYRPFEGLEGRSTFTVTNRSVMGSPTGDSWRSTTYGVHTSQQYLGAWTIYGDGIISDYRLPFSVGESSKSQQGTAYGYGFNYDGNYFTASASDTRVSPDARMDLGFLSITGLKSQNLYLTTRIRSNDSFWTQIRGGINVTNDDAWDESPFDRYRSAYVTASFKHKIDLTFTKSFSSKEWFLGKVFDEPGTSGNLMIGTIPGQTLSMTVSTGKVVDYFHGVLVDSHFLSGYFAGRIGPVSYQINPTMLKLNSSEYAVQTLKASRLYGKLEWAMPWDNWYFRTEFQSVATERIQNITDSNSLLSMRTKTMGYLLRWQPNPFAGVFLGYNQIRSAEDRFSIQEYNRLAQKGLFIKVSYSKQF